MTLEELLTMLKILSTLIIAVGLVFTGIQILLTRKQLIEQNRQLLLTRKIHSDNHDWNRRYASQQTLKESVDVERIIEIEAIFNTHRVKEAIPIAEINAAFEEKPETRIHLNQLLNQYERYARGIIQGIYDEEVIKMAVKGKMVRTFKYFENFVTQQRDKINPNLWVQYESLIGKWNFEEKSPKQRSLIN